MQMFLAQLLWQSPSAAPLAAAFGVATLVTVFWLYPSQVKTVKRPWRWMMPLLRTLALLALAAALLQPVTLRPRTVEQQGAIVVLFDRSKSMSVVDAGRSPAERVALAAGIGALPNGARDVSALSQRRELEQLKRLAEEARTARNEFDYATLAGRDSDQASKRLASSIARIRASAKRLPTSPAMKPLSDQITAAPDAPTEAALTQLIAVVHSTESAVDAAQAASDTALYESNAEVRAICDALVGISRAALAEKGLAGAEGILSQIPSGTPVYSFAFDDELLAVPSFARGGNATPLIAPDGTSSDITGALRATFERVSRLTPQAIILASDGRQVSGDAPPGAALLAGTNAPVFTLDPTGPATPDLSISGVTLPPRVYIGETAAVRVELLGHGEASAPVEVKLETSDPASAQSRTIILEAGRASADFSLKLGTAGIEKVRVTVSPLAHEASLENNTVERWIKVVSNKVKVTTISPSPSWDYQYARNALSRAPGVQLTDATTANLAVLPALSPDVLRTQDVVILSDVHAEALTAPQWTALLDLVTQRGGSLIILANDLSVLRQYEADARLSGLLPYRSGLQSSWQVWPGREPEYHLGPARGAEQLATASLDPGADANGRAWQQLPGMFRYLAMPELKAGSRALLVERQRAAPVLTETRIGAGRVLFVGVNETWRWRRGVGERYQDRFWLQLVRHGSDDPYAVHADGLWLDVEPLVAAPGEPLTIRARASNPPGSPPSAALRVKISSGANVIADMAMTPLSAGGRFEAMMARAPGPGNYEVTVTESKNPERTVSSTLLVKPPDARAEMINLAGDPILLQRIAESSGGRYITLNQLPLLAAELKRLRQRQSTLAEYTLWDSPYLFAFVLACLGAEWALRKRFGLA